MFDSVKHNVPEVLVCIWKLAVIIIARIDLQAHYSSVPKILFVMHGADPHRTASTSSDVIATDPGDNPTLCCKFATTRNHIRTTRDEITLTLIFFSCQEPARTDTHAVTGRRYDTSCMHLRRLAYALLFLRDSHTIMVWLSPMMNIVKWCLWKFNRLLKIKH